MQFVHIVTGNSSAFSHKINPPIDVDLSQDIEVGLVKFFSYNDIPNITEGVNNKLYYRVNIDEPNDVIELETGTYDIININEAINDKLDKQLNTLNRKKKINVTSNAVTLKSIIESDFYIDFTQEGTIGPLLGFNKILLHPEKTHSNNIVKIIDVDMISVEVNIAEGAYKNGIQGHSIYQCSLSVDPGYRIVEAPKNITYFPVNKKRIDRIDIRLTDQKGDLVNLRSDSVSIELQFKVKNKTYGSRS